MGIGVYIWYVVAFLHVFVFVFHVCMHVRISVCMAFSMYVVYARMHVMYARQFICMSWSDIPCFAVCKCM